MINFITISILDFRVTSHNVIDQSMIINFEMKKISGGEAKQNPRESAPAFFAKSIVNLMWIYIFL